MATAAMVLTASKQSPSPPWGGDSWKWSEAENQSKPEASAPRQRRRRPSRGRTGAPPREPAVPSGLARRRRSRISGPRLSTIGVQTWPGAMALTRMPLGPSWAAVLRTEPMTAASAPPRAPPPPRGAGARGAAHVCREGARLAGFRGDEAHRLVGARRVQVHAEDASALAGEEDRRGLAVADPGAPGAPPPD